jgi:outer membrane lipopolysaccharide assembly protein LptE/RlpB
MIRVLLLLPLVLYLSACGQKSEQAATPPPKIFKEQREALDQAKALQDSLNQQAEQAKQKLDEAESDARK